MEVPIVFENVSKSYTLYHNLIGFKHFLFHLPHIVQATRKSKFKALDEVSFTLQRGETVGFIGPNGAGKSTILGLIAGVLQPTQGKVVVHGRISPILELGAGFHPELTGMENMYLNAILLGMTREEVRRSIPGIIEFSELADFIEQPIRTYSSGMVARLAFSIAVHINPDILLIDEILAVGDAHFQKKSFEKIMEFKKRGVTIVLVSHAMEAVKTVCDSVIWLERGKILEMGNHVSEILERYRQKYGG
jgi:lipopolysaccharide transport system ATP-binding protein